jgi:DNA polymerase-1
LSKKSRPFGKFERIQPELDFEFDYLDSRPKLDVAEGVLIEAPYIAIDIETTGLNVFEEHARILSIAFACPGYIAAMPFRWAKSDDLDALVEYGEDDEMLRYRKLFLEHILTSGKPLIGHNGKFDGQWLWKMEGISLDDYCYDTMLAHYLLNELKQLRGLKHLGAIYTSHPIFDLPQKDNLDELEQELVISYNASDARLTLALYEIFKKEIKKQDLIRLWKLISRVSQVFGRMEFAGIKVDPLPLQEAKEKYTDKLDGLNEALVSFADKKGRSEINLDSPKQLGEFLFDNLKLPVFERTPTGQPSTKESILEKLDHPFIKCLLVYRKTGKFLRTYITGLEKAIVYDGRVHPQYNLTGTVTGRTSCSKPNLQNIPRGSEIRGLFIADTEQDKILIEADYDQFELRVLTLYSKDESLVKVFRSGRDPHIEAASFLFKKPIEEIDKEERTRAKNLNFGILYGMSPESLGDYLDCTTKEAEKLIRRYFSTFTDVDDWQQGIHEQVMIDKEVISLFKRRRRFPQLNDPKSLRERDLDDVRKQSVNALIQSAASDFALMGLLRVSKLLDNDVIPVLFVHDSLIIECPKKKAADTIDLLRSELVYFAKSLPIPFTVEIGVGYNWGNMVEYKE